MPVNVAAVRPDAPDVALGVPLIGPVRASEDIAVGATGSVVAQNGEVFRVASTESSPVKIALGITPNAGATVATAVTTAGFTIQPNSVEYVSPVPGERVAVAT